MKSPAIFNKINPFLIENTGHPNLCFEDEESDEEDGSEEEIVDSPLKSSVKSSKKSLNRYPKIVVNISFT